MHRILQGCSVLFAVTVFATMAYAEGSASAAKGKVLFNSTALGTNGKSCATCHPGGKGLEEAAGSDAMELEKVTNRCIEKALKGKPLANGSVELTSLITYQKTLGAVKAK